MLTTGERTDKKTCGQIYRQTDRNIEVRRGVKCDVRCQKTLSYLTTLIKSFFFALLNTLSELELLWLGQE